MSRPSASTGGGEHLGHCRITVASLCSNVDEADSALTEPTEVDRSHGLKAFSASGAIRTLVKCDQLEYPETAVSQPSLPLVRLQYHNGRGIANYHSKISRLHTADNFDSAHASISGDSFNINTAAGYPSVIHRETVQRQDRSSSMAVLSSSTMRTTAARSEMLRTRYSASLRVQSTGLAALAGLKPSLTDCSKVDERANHFSKDFLVELGFLQTDVMAISDALAFQRRP